MIYFCLMPVRDRRRGRLRENEDENRIKAACLMSQVDCSHLPKKKLHSGKMVSEVDCSDPHKKAHSDHPDFAPASVTGLSAIANEHTLRTGATTTTTCHGES